MPQQIGQSYRTLVPTFSDAASIEEALKLYHYGVPNYTSQAIPDDSIEGNFRKLKTSIDNLQTLLDNLQSTTGYVRSVSQTSAPNVMTAQSAATVPLSIRAIVSQTASLQEWQNSSASAVAAVSPNGGMYLASYLAISSTSFVTNIGLLVGTSNNSHTAIVAKAAASQSDAINIQEWRDNGNNVLAKVTGTGNFLAPNITGSTTVSSAKMTVTGTQTLNEFRIRNVYASNLDPLATDGAVGDVWFTHEL